MSWSYAQDGKVAVDVGTGILSDANPAFEALVGYSHDELVGMHFTKLHPASEHERVQDEFSKKSAYASIHSGFHVERKDGRLVPVQVWSSDSLIFNGQNMAIVEFRDITRRLENQHKFAAQNWALSAFSGAAIALSQARSESELLQSICEAITYQSAYALAFVSVAEDGPKKPIRFAAASRSALDFLQDLRLSWAEDDPDSEGPSGVCIRTRQIQILDDLETAPSFVRWRERAKEFGVCSAVGIPLSIDDSWNAALVVFSSDSHAFEVEPVQVFQRLGEQIVHGILALRHKQLLDAERLNLERTQRQLTDALSASVAAMVTAMEARDPYTAGHESRVADISVAIGREMGWEMGRLQGLRLGAMVHDIGKIAIPAEILSKPARLSPAEYSMVKEHPETGYSILKDVPFLWPIADMVRQHHEKLDGSGYPLGLKADQILPESKVLAVADIVEAMASMRPYRPARGLGAALAEIESQAGEKLDAEVVRICGALFRERRLIVQGLNWI